MPAAALAAVVHHYHGGAVLYTLAMAPVPPVASALARAISARGRILKKPLSSVTHFPTLVGLGLAVGAVVVVVGSVFRRWRPPGERSLLERFFGSSEDRYRALAVIVIVAVLSVPFTFWLYAAYPTYQPFFTACSAPRLRRSSICTGAGLYSRGLSNAVVFLGHTTAIAFIAASPDYVADPGFLVPGVMTATALDHLVRAPPSSSGNCTRSPAIASRKRCSHVCRETRRQVATLLEQASVALLNVSVETIVACEIRALYSARAQEQITN